MQVYRTVFAAALAVSIFAKSGVAQNTVNRNHLVSVTVPGPVRVQVTQVQPRLVSVASAGTVAKEVSLNIDASRGWVVSIENGASNSRSGLQWSNDGGRFAPLVGVSVPVIAGKHLTQVTTRVAVRATGGDVRDAEHGILLSITAP